LGRRERVKDDGRRVRGRDFNLAIKIGGNKGRMDELQGRDQDRGSIWERSKDFRSNCNGCDVGGRDMGYYISSNPVGCRGIRLTNAKDLVIRNRNSYTDACVGKGKKQGSVCIIELDMSNILSLKKGYHLSWAWHVRNRCANVYTNEAIWKKGGKCNSAVGFRQKVLITIFHTKYECRHCNTMFRKRISPWPKKI
jgi:hypothetical protein